MNTFKKSVFAAGIVCAGLGSTQAQFDIPLPEADCLTCTFEAVIGGSCDDMVPVFENLQDCNEVCGLKDADTDCSTAVLEFNEVECPAGPTREACEEVFGSPAALASSSLLLVSAGAVAAAAFA